MFGLTQVLPVAAASPFVHPLFTSDMVLQRDAADPVWGWAPVNATVTVVVKDQNGVPLQTNTAVADLNGRWQAAVGPFGLVPNNAAFSVIVSAPGQATVTLTNVLIGDVLLCAGQSNMAFSLNTIGVTNLTEEIADSTNYPLVRCFTVPEVKSLEPTNCFSGGSWQIPGLDTTGNFTATGYFTAREIYKQQHIPIGILCSAWPGTEIECWVDQAFASSLSDFTQPIFDQTLQSSVRSVVSYLYNAMIYPLAPFRVKVVEWYQGEWNAGNPEQYSRMLPGLMSEWRALFGQPDLPFLIVQLPNINGTQTQPVETGSWAELREAQLKTVLNDAHSRLVTTIDIGGGALHPIDKQDVGLRAAWAAASLLYHQNVVNEGPIMTTAAVSGNSIVCTFTNVGGGLMIGAKTLSPLSPVQPVTGGTLANFAISGANKVFYAANATITATNQVTVSSPNVGAPVAVRYAWGNNPPCNLYSSVTDGSGNVTNGIPASPFRNDPVNRLMVNCGSGTGYYASNAVITVTASNYTAETFHHWSGDTNLIANFNAASTTVTQAQEYVSILANYQLTGTISGLATVIQPGQIALSWNPLNGVHYLVYRSTTNGGPYTLMAINSPDSQTNYVDLNVIPGTTYYYVVVPTNLLGAGATSLQVSASTMPNTTETWDANGAVSPNPSDGSGLWLGGSNWWTGSTNIPGTWSGTAVDSAIIGAGVSGSYTIDLGGNSLSASNLVFAASGYMLTNGTLNLVGAGTTVNTNVTATVNAVMTTGPITVNSGAFLTLGGGGSMGNAAGLGTLQFASTAAKTITSANGVLDLGTPDTLTGGVVVGDHTAFNANGTLGIGDRFGALSGVGLVVVNSPTASINNSSTGIVVGRRNSAAVGRLVIKAGSVNATAGISVVQNAGCTGEIDVWGGTLNCTPVLTLYNNAGAGGTATFQITNGLVSMGTAGTFSLGNASATGGSAVFAMSGGAFYPGSGGIIKQGTVATSLTLSGGTMGANANWSSSLDLTLTNTGGVITFQAADTNGTAQDITLSGGLSGVGGLTKTGAGILTLGGANSYSGATVINAGTLALNGNSSLGSSASVSLAAGATLDVSGLSSSTFVLNSGTELSASGTGTAVGSTAAAIAGNVAGTVDLGDNNIVLNYDGSHPALYVSAGTLKLHGNTFTVNSPSPLAPGSYTLIQQAAGNITGTGSYPPVTGTALGENETGSITVTGGTVVLTVLNSVVTVNGLTANGKIYDATTQATINTNGYTLNGVAPGDVGNVYLVTNGYTAAFDTPNVGAGKTIWVAGLSLGGSASANYTLQQPVMLTANITNAGTTLKLNCANTNAQPGWPFTFLASLTSTGWLPTNEPVTFATNGVIMGTATLDGAGVATLTVPLNPGSYTITAGYAGDSNVRGSTNTVTFGLATNGVASLIWDADTNVTGAQDGSGLWNSAAGNWWNGATDRAWGDGSNATFGFGRDGVYAITLGDTLTVSNLYFNASGYSLSNGEVYVVPNGGITVAGGRTATIDSLIGDNNNSVVSFTANTGAVLNLGGGFAVSVQGSFFGPGTINLTGGTYPFVISRFNAAAVNQTGGTVNLSGSSGVGNWINYGAGQDVDYTISGGSLNLNGTGAGAYLGLGRSSGNNTGTLTVQAGGTVNIGMSSPGQINLPHDGGSNGKLDVQGGALTVGTGDPANQIYFFSQGSSSGKSGTMTQEGGVVTVQGILFGAASGSYSSGANATLTLTGGSLYVGNLGITEGVNHPTDNVTFSGGTVGAAADWNSAMNLSLGNNGGPVTFQAADQNGAAHHITLSGVLSGSQGFIKSGDGMLLLTGANTYAGTTIINGGNLLLAGNGSANGSSGFVLTNGGSFTLMNSAGANLNNRIGNAAPITMSDGDFAFTNDGGAENYSETAGALLINSGANVVMIFPAAGGQTSTVTFASLVHNGGSVDFQMGSAGTSQNRVFFSTPPTLGSWITVNGEPARYDSTNGLQGTSTYVDIAALGSTVTNAPASNVRINFTGSGGNIQLGSPTTAINSLQQNTTTAATVDTAGKTLLANQIMINAGLAALAIGAAPGDGILTAGSLGGDLLLVNSGGFAPGLVINAALANNTLASSLTVAGSGTVTLAAPFNAYNGGTTISNGATLAVMTSGSTMPYTIAGGTLSVRRSGLGVSLPMSHLSFGNGASQLAFDLDGVANVASPLIDDSGDLVMNGNVLVNITNASPGTGVLLQYAGTRSGTGQFVPGNVPTGMAVIDDPVSRAVYFVYVSGPTVIVPPHNTNEIVVAVATPQQFGAKGDGVTDDTAAFQNAMNAASNAGGAGGGVVYVPAGVYAFSNALTIPPGVTLQGDWTDWSLGTNGVAGTLFKVYAGAGQSNGTPFITINKGALKGVSIWYPNQDPANILPYPFTLKISGDTLVQNVALINSYQGINAYSATKHILSTVIGSPLKLGITLDAQYDISHQEDVRFSPDFWAESKLPGAPALNGPQAAWMRAHGTAELLYRGDGEACMDLNISGYNVGVLAAVSTNGGPNVSFYGGSISNCGTAYLDDAGGGNTGFEFTHITLDGDIAVDRTSTPNDASAYFHTCQLIGRSGTALRQTGGTSSTMQLQNCTIAGTVQVDGGIINVVNSTLTVSPGSNQCNLASSAIYAAFTGCIFKPVRQISNAADPRRLAIDGRRASTSPLPVVHWSDIQTNWIGCRPAKLDLLVATDPMWGAVGDGVVDDTAAIQSALNAAGTNGGGIVYLPPGKYKTTGTLDVPSGVELRGSYPSVHQSPLYDGHVKVTVLQPYGGAGATNGPPAVALEASAGIVGMTIQYEDQDTNCTPYPPTIQGRGGNVYAIGVLCPNPYWFVDLNSYTCTNHFLQQVDGWALRYGFTIGNGSSGTLVQCMANETYWWDSNFSASQDIGSWRSTIDAFVYHDQEWFLLGDCTELLVKNFDIPSHTFMRCIDQNGRGPWINGIITECDAAVNCFLFEAAAPCQINIVNPEWMVTLSGGYGDLTNYGVVSTPSFQGTVRFFNSPLWGGRPWDYWIQGGDVGFELVHMGYLSTHGSKVDGGVLHLINCGFEGNTSAYYTVPFNSASPGVPGKVSEIIGCYAWTGVTNSRANINNPINCWGNFGINKLTTQTPFDVTPPDLQFEQGSSAGTISLVWTNGMGAFELYSAPSLAPPVVWSEVTNAPYFAGNNWTVTNSANGMPEQFYRLAQ